MEELVAKLKAYTPPLKAAELLNKSQTLLLVGPTGAGKNTLEDHLLKTGHFKPIVTHTSRPPRLNHGVMEQEGEEYHFISNAQALKMLGNEEFIEAAIIHGNFYGTSIKEFEIAISQAKVAVADIDVKGVRSYRKLSDQVMAIFLLPPSFDILLNRLINRYGKTGHEADIKTRLQTAVSELEELLSTNYYWCLINVDMASTLTKTLSYVDSEVKPASDAEALTLVLRLITDIKQYLTTLTSTLD